MTLFQQLYTGTLAVLMLITLLLSLVVNYYLRQDDINDFLNDVSKSTQELRTEVLASGKHPSISAEPVTQDCGNFCVSWLSPQGLEAFATTASLLAEHEHRSVYELTTRSGFAAVYHYPEQNAHLLVTDTPAFSDHADEFHHDDEEEALGWFFPWLYIGLGALGVALVLYVLSRRIEKAIYQLQGVVSSYDASWEKRADEACPEPVRQLATSFNQMAERLEEQRREQQIMTHAIAHELRTPLARMRLALGMIEPPKENDATQGLLGDLDRYVTDMDRLTSDVLLLGRISQTHSNHAPKIEAVNMSKVLEQRLEFLTSEQYSKVHAVIQPEVYIMIAANHLQLLVDNLLNNALAYAQTEVTVVLHKAPVEAGNIDQSMITFRVEDDGPGIDEVQKEQLFVPFYRGDESRNRKTGGFGLGLAIVRSIARRYEGEVTVVNQVSGGAVFSLTGFNST